MNSHHHHNHQHKPFNGAILIFFITTLFSLIAFGYCSTLIENSARDVNIASAISIDVKKETRDKLYGKNHILYIASFNVSSNNNDQVTVTTSLISTNGDTSLPIQIEVWPIDDTYGYISNITLASTMKEQILLEYNGKSVQQYYVRVRSFYVKSTSYGEFSISFTMEKKLEYGLIFGLAIGIPCGILLLFIVLGAVGHVKIQKMRLDNYDRERQASAPKNVKLKPNVKSNFEQPEYEVEPLPILSNLPQFPKVKEEPPKHQTISSEDLIKFEGQSMVGDEAISEISVVVEDDVRVSMPRVPLPKYIEPRDAVSDKIPQVEPTPSSTPPPPYVESEIQPVPSEDEMNFDISVPLPDKI